MKTIVISLSFILFLSTDAISCTIFSFTRGGKTYFCNNEDFSRTDTEIRFYPAEKGKYAWVYLGFSGGWAQGGVNEKGLCWDWVAGGVENSWKKDKTKKTFKGNLSQKIITECATIEEAIAYYEKYNEPSFAYARTMIADKYGNSVIIGWKDGKLDIQRNKGNLQALGYGKEAVESYFSCNPNARGVNCLAAALNAAHQEGGFPTQYSNIISQGDGKIFLYKNHCYSEYVEIDYLEILKTGYSKYKIRELFDGNIPHPWILLFKEVAAHSNGEGLHCKITANNRSVLSVCGDSRLSRNYFFSCMDGLLQDDNQLIQCFRRGNGKSDTRTRGPKT